MYNISLKGLDSVNVQTDIGFDKCLAQDTIIEVWSVHPRYNCILVKQSRFILVNNKDSNFLWVMIILFVTT